ncbi:MAG: hypothetical protein WC444_05260 [Candidatus Paceibacterota bacterium]
MFSWEDLHTSYSSSHDQDRRMQTLAEIGAATMVQAFLQWAISKDCKDCEHYDPACGCYFNFQECVSGRMSFYDNFLSMKE